MGTQEMSIQLTYERHADGRYYIRSENLPGFHLAGTNFDAMQADLNDVVKDLLLHNENFVVQELRWVPGPEDIKRHLSKPGPEGKGPQDLPSFWTVIFAVWFVAGSLLLCWQPRPVTLGLLIVVGAVAAFFHWRDQPPKVPHA